MHVALIHPPPATAFEAHWARFPVLGLAYVAASLRAQGHRITLLDGKLDGLSVDQIVDRVAQDQPDLVGITSMTVEYPLAMRIATRIKERVDVPIALGGAHVNAVNAQALEECPALDFGCVGEGEHLANDLARALDRGDTAYENIPGLLFRRDGAVQFSGQRPYPDDYDALPFPAWDLFRVGEQIPLLTHRGCPFQCVFCGHNSGFKARYRSPENVLEEITYVIERFKPAILRVEDETFGLNMVRTKAILQGILERGFHHRVRFSAQTRVDRVDEEFIDLLRDANFETLELGVESGNPQMLKRIKKGITLEQVERAVGLARSRGMRVWCKFILGHPDETVDTIRDTVNFIARINPDRLSVAIMTPYPGTPIHAMALRGEGGYRLIGQGWESYDKYSSGALELEHVSLGQLKFYQLWCYLKMYLVNRRLWDALRIVVAHHGLAWGMLSGFVAQRTAEWFAPRRPRAAATA